MSEHIPSHGAISLVCRFFAHLVDVLGPSELLGPLCLLLVDKVSNKIVRQVAVDSSNSLSLPLGTLHRYGVELQIAVCHLDSVQMCSQSNVPTDDG